MNGEKGMGQKQWHLGTQSRVLMPRQLGHWYRHQVRHQICWCSNVCASRQIRCPIKIHGCIDGRIAICMGLDGEWEEGMTNQASPAPHAAPRPIILHSSEP